MPQTDEVLDFTNMIGPFYEFVDDKSNHHHITTENGPTTSTVAALKKQQQQSANRQTIPNFVYTTLKNGGM